MKIILTATITISSIRISIIRLISKNRLIIMILIITNNNLFWIENIWKVLRLHVLHTCNAISANNLNF